MIGKTEEVILLTLVRIGETSPAVATEEIRKVIPIHLGAVYTILNRMVEKGWVLRRDPEARKGRGFPRSFFKISAAGRRALKDSIDTTNQFISGIDL
jgi:DNA-binding PadR family transcriptional regulator